MALLSVCSRGCQDSFSPHGIFWGMHLSLEYMGQVTSEIIAV